MNNSYKSNKERGGAVVETGVMMIILVPLIFYVFLMTDLTYQILNTQEAVISTVWDFFEAPFGVYSHRFWGKTSTYHGGVDNFNRWEFGDHTSATLKFDWAKDGHGTGGASSGSSRENKKQYVHDRPWLEVTWGDSGGQDQVNNYSDSQYYSTTKSNEVACERQDDFGTVVGLPLYGIPLKKESTSGKYVCWAKAKAKNYLIPKFFSAFGRVDENKDKLIESRAKGVMGNRNVEDGETWIVLRNRASVVAGDWSSIKDQVVEKTFLGIDTSVRNVTLVPRTDSVFYTRSLAYYEGGYAAAGVLSAVNQYFKEVKDQKVAQRTIMGPLPEILYMAAVFSHKGSDYDKDDYTFWPGIGIVPIGEHILAGKRYTVSNRWYLSKANSTRGVYYMAQKQQLR